MAMNGYEWLIYGQKMKNLTVHGWPDELLGPCQRAASGPNRGERCCHLDEEKRVEMQGQYMHSNSANGHGKDLSLS